MIIGNEEEEYAAGGGSERGSTAGRTLRRAGEGRFGAETRKRRYVLSRARFLRHGKLGGTTEEELFRPSG